MNRSRNPAVLATNPFLLWNSLAMKSAEMLMASAQVISHRTGRMVTAGIIPSQRDQREFSLMGQEKIEAMTESMQAISLRIQLMQQQLAATALRQMLTGTASFMLFASSTNPVQQQRAQAKILRDVYSNTAGSAARFANSLAGVAQHGLKPIHSRATANARRLGHLKADI